MDEIEKKYLKKGWEWIIGKPMTKIWRGREVEGSFAIQLGVELWRNWGKIGEIG
jgi:hypothetical protein